MREISISLDDFSNVYEIPLSANANYEFDTAVGGLNLTIKFQTFYNGETRMTILNDGVAVCQDAPISIFFQNLLLYSTIENSAIFLANFSKTLRHPTYENLGNEIRLYYGVY